MAKKFNRIARIALMAGTAMVAMPMTAAEVEGWGNFKLYLDPGHAGRENQGLWGYSEAEKTLRVALNIRDFLSTYTDMPVDAIKLCRETDQDQISLEERSDEANAWGADFYYSIHSDASASVNTIVTLFGGWCVNGELVEKTPNGGKAYGEFLNPNLSGVMRIGSRGNRYDRDFYMPTTGTHDNQYPYLSVNRRSNMPSLLSEGGYHTLAEQQQRNINDDYKRLEAFAAFQSILQYRGLNRPEQTFLTGMVTNSENNQPINGATITVGDRTYTTDTYESLFYKYTKNHNLIHNGFYMFEGLEAGSQVEVKFEAPGFESKTETVVINNGGDTSADYVTFLDVALTNASPAKVDAISLSDLESVSSLYPLTITFSRNMDRASVEAAFSIDNDATCALSWVNDYTLNVDLSTLEPLWEYTVTIDGSVAKNSQTGQFLDGDGDGAEGGNYVLTFTMAEPDVTAPEVVATYPDAEGEALYNQRPPISIQFDEIIDWNEDRNSGWIEVKDSKGKVYEIGHVQHAIVGEASVLMCYLAEDLAADVAVLVSVKAVKDLWGNEGDPFAFRFLSEYRNKLTSEEIIPLDAMGDFWAPNGSGSTKGLTEEGNEAGTFGFSPYHGQNSAFYITYAFDPDYSDESFPNGYWYIRDHNKTGANNQLKGQEGVITMWVYGDNSGNRTGFLMRDFSTNALVFKKDKMVVDFLGWRPFIWDFVNDEIGNFTGDAGAQKFRKWYFDAIFIDHNFEDGEAITDPDEDGYTAWNGTMAYYELVRTTWDETPRTAAITDIDLPGSGIDSAVAAFNVSYSNGIVTVSTEASIAVYGIDGRVELATSGSSANLSGLAAGVHIVRVATAQGTRTIKVVL